MNKSPFVLASILVFPLWTSAVPTYTEIFSYPFTGQPGCNPSSKPLEASDGALYGTTARIFAAVPYRDDGAGLLYRINKDGTGHTVLHLFDGSTSPNASALIQTKDGALWGTTGRRDPEGTIYKVNLDGSGFTTVHTFAALPAGALLEASDGAIYGVVAGEDPGLIYKINQDGSGFRVIHRFTSSPLPARDGWTPTGSLIECKDGFLYGTTKFGGIGNKGTIFRLSKDGTQFITLYSFTGGDDGENPHTGVIEGTDGVLYGTTGGLGFHGHGSVFRINADGTGFAVLRKSDPDVCACISSPPEAHPPPPTNSLVLEDMIESSDGLLYVSGAEIFKIAKDGSGYTVFKNPDGTYDYSSPVGMIEGTDGVLYAASVGGGRGRPSEW